MDDFLQISEQNQREAREIIKKLDIENVWKSIGAEINLVGSLKMGLLMKHLDIDFHVYTENVSISESLSAILKISKNPQVKSFRFKNLLKTDENCLEWHLIYTDESGRDWQIDIIHMPLNSKYRGYFENIAERIQSRLTPDTKRTILRLKYETPDNMKIMGIEYYRAVLDEGVSTFEKFAKFREFCPAEGIVDWVP